MLESWLGGLKSQDPMKRASTGGLISEALREHPYWAQDTNSQIALAGIITRMLRDDNEAVRGMGMMILETERLTLPQALSGNKAVSTLKSTLQGLTTNPKINKEEADVASRIISQWDTLLHTGASANNGTTQSPQPANTAPAPAPTGPNGTTSPPPAKPASMWSKLFNLGKPPTGILTPNEVL
jgi:hypothetical protein